MPTSPLRRARWLTGPLVAAALALALPFASGCVRCHEFAPGTRLAQAAGQGGFAARPQSGGPETRPSK